MATWHGLNVLGAVLVTLLGVLLAGVMWWLALDEWRAWRVRRVRRALRRRLREQREGRDGCE
jgi:hypothetical protein